MSYYKAEYIWVDGTEPMALLRSKTKILKKGEEPDTWGFDGSSTSQASGDASDCVLKPVRVAPDPIRGGDNLLVLCEVFDVNGDPHPSNTRAPLRKIAEEFSSFEMLFGMEQEYTFFKGNAPLGWPKDGYPAPQGPYYCSVGANFVFGREIVEEHMDACLIAGIRLSGINAEVMPGQWEFQVGPIDPLAIGDEIHLARWLLDRIAESHSVHVSYQSKPVKGDWNGAGCHTNFSTKQMRDNYEACIEACESLGTRVDEHIDSYGHGIEDRLTGLHETCSFREYRYGVSDRGASVRIPWHVAKAKKGYVEDRRPNASCDPYVVATMITDTVCRNAKN
tara:strand:+ start:422 stop:1426 length:1005 start_codon:yes stop_codon:yes gene_type:complete